MDIDDVEKVDFVIKTVGSLSMLKSLFKRMGFAQIIGGYGHLTKKTK